MEPRREERIQKKSRTKGIIILSVLLLLAAAGFAGGQIYISRNIDIDTFYEGISIDGDSVSGMNKEEALAALETANRSNVEQYNIDLLYKDQKWNFNYEDIAVGTDVKQVIDQAYQVGRKGNILKRMETVWGLKSNPVDYKTKITYSVDVLKGELEKVARTINQAPVDAAITFQPDAKEKFTITPEKAGYQTNVEQILKKIEEGLANNPQFTMNIEPQKIQPKVFAKDLEKQTHKLTTFSTSLGSSSANRKHNVYLSIKQFNGLVLQPGQEVSFNQTTGQRTRANGYEAAPVIKADKSLEDDLGGGVCQTSSTIYNAVLYSGLDIVQRSHHSFPSTYVSKGLDATVNWPNLDLIFKNNRTTPVYFRTYYGGNRVYVEVYGEPLPNKQEVKLVTDVYKRYSAPAPKIVKDTKQQYVKYEDETYEKVKSRPGYKVRSYRIVYENGKEVSREVLNDDFYKPITGLIYKGTQPRPVAETKDEGQRKNGQQPGNEN